ncbi:MAG TPA: TonB-dependent receptor, partial [Bacteroidota bacterium]|nr:TonB-dependent receptor [Bacteroidota bacterium]
VLEKGEKDVLLPNAPKHKLNGGITYINPAGLSANVTAKYIPSFDWAAGIYQGKIHAYTLVNLSASYRFTRNFSAGINVGNLLDRTHYEIFGGSIIGRRVIAILNVLF